MKQKKNKKLDINKIKEAGRSARGEPGGEENDPGSGEVSLDPKEIPKNH